MKDKDTNDMKKYFLVSILLLLGTMLGTATAQTITGKVTDPSRQPIDGATVVLQTPDSIFVEATITNADGTFLLNHQPARYRLLFQHLLYEPQEKEGTGTDAGTFTLQPKDYALQEVVVQGERPLVTVEGSRLTYDMPQLTSQRLVTNAYEALKQLPGVIEQNDVLTLAGAGGVSLLLNGRPSSMTYEQLVTLLKGIPASRVEKAEVMYSAPPQYHVRGAAINLVLNLYTEQDLRFQANFVSQPTGYPHGLQWPLVAKYFGNEQFMAQNMLHVCMPKVFRLSEQYLIRAEARANQDNMGGASKDLSDLRKARFQGGNGAISVTKQNWLEIIEEERVRELYMEGFRLQDLKRWHKGFERKPQQQSLANGSSLKIEADDVRFVWPIPKHELDSPGSEIQPNESNK